MPAKRLLDRLRLGALASRPRLVGAILVGVTVAAGLAFIPNDLRWSSRAIFAWDAACGVFIVACLSGMGGRRDRDIQERAAREDEGRGLILALVVIAAAASLGAIAIELSLARGEQGWPRGLRVGLGFATVAASWFVVQLIFALHYAHEYYSASPDKPLVPRRGLDFPGDEPPDYWDFLHFAVIIGVASQTADIAFTRKSLRRAGTIHSAFAFVFNTIVLALTINLLAGLF